MKILDGSIYTDDFWDYYRGFCKLIFDDFFIIIRWPSIVGYEEKISYHDLAIIYHSRFYGRVKFVYFKNNKQESIFFKSSSFAQKNFFLSSDVQDKISLYNIDFIEYSRRNKSYSNIIEYIKFWRLWNL